MFHRSGDAAQLTSSGEAKLCDLGMASLAAIQQVGVFPQPWNSNPPSQGVQTEPPKLPPAGSPRYMPPEVTAGGGRGFSLTD